MDIPSLKAMHLDQTGERIAGIEGDKGVAHTDEHLLLQLEKGEPFPAGKGMFLIDDGKGLHPAEGPEQPGTFAAQQHVVGDEYKVQLLFLKAVENLVIVLDEDVGTDGGVLPPEPGKDRREHHHLGVGGTANAQHLKIPLGGEAVGNLFKFVQDLPGRRIEGLPGRSQTHRVFVPDEQRHAQLRLQRLDVMGHRRHRKVEFIRRLGKAEFIRHRHKAAQFLGIHTQSSLRLYYSRFVRRCLMRFHLFKEHGRDFVIQF